MSDKATKIIQESLDALMQDEAFLPDYKGQERETAFSSLISILSTPNHVHKSFLRVPRKTAKWCAYQPTVCSTTTPWGLTKAACAFMKA